jgi:hypothetical protein
MNFQGSVNKIEATFWESIIKLMSNSPAFQNLVRKTFHVVKEKEVVWLTGLVLAWTAAGLTVGYFLGFQGLR